MVLGSRRVGPRGFVSYESVCVPALVRFGGRYFAPLGQGVSSGVNGSRPPPPVFSVGLPFADPHLTTEDVQWGLVWWQPRLDPPPPAHLSLEPTLNPKRKTVPVRLRPQWHLGGRPPGWAGLMLAVAEGGRRSQNGRPSVRRQSALPTGLLSAPNGAQSGLCWRELAAQPLFQPPTSAATTAVAKISLTPPPPPPSPSSTSLGWVGGGGGGSLLPAYH